VRVLRQDLSGGLWGLTTAPNRVLIQRDLSEDDLTLTLAHELAHVLIRQGAAQLPVTMDEEWFADCFAHEFLLPTAVLRSLPLDRRFPGIPRETVALQIARANRVQGLVTTDLGQLMCTICGHRRGRHWCICQRAA
jgi:Zn-dependent peptidase ImmA (M78 family)